MFTYIYTQNPPLFTFSLSETRESQFSNELIAICSAEDTELLERPNYQPSRAAAAVLSAQNQTRIVALRQAAISECCCCYFLEISHVVHLYSTTLNLFCPIFHMALESSCLIYIKVSKITRNKCKFLNRINFCRFMSIFAYHFPELKEREKGVGTDKFFFARF